MNPFNSMIVIAIIVGALMTIDHARNAPDDLDHEQATYCEMVKTFKESNGQYGWPDYRGNARRVCK